jgi:hypothetical protein
MINIKLEFVSLQSLLSETVFLLNNGDENCFFRMKIIYI